MDPLSQAVVGALLPQALARTNSIRTATLAGIAGGLAADLDVLIRSSEDQLLQVEYHRHFTHSLLFVPVGGLIVGAALWPLIRKKTQFGQAYLWSTLGFLTAGLLDACTSYGTRLFWPFSQERIAWDLISIIDPVFTFTVLVLVVLAARRRSPGIARWGWIFVFSYLSLGLVQQHRSESIAFDLAERRGDKISRLVVKPSIGNLFLWRSTYETRSGHIQADGIRPGLFGASRIYEGERCRKLSLDDAAQGAPPSSTLRKDLMRFAHFSDRWLGRHPTEARVVGDMRYAAQPDQLQPLWGIELDHERPEAHVRWVTFRQADRAALDRLWTMILGRELPASRSEGVVR